MSDATPSENAQLTRNRAAFTELVSEELEHFRWQREKVELVKSVIQAIPKRGVLADIGCFTGLATEQYRSGFERAVGFDASESALPVAAARGIEARRWLAGSERCPASKSESGCIADGEIGSDGRSESHYD